MRSEPVAMANSLLSGEAGIAHPIESGAALRVENPNKCGPAPMGAFCSCATAMVFPLHPLEERES